MKEFLLCSFLAGHELHIVQQEDIHGTVFVVELGHLLVANGIDQLVDKGLCTEINDMQRPVLLDLIAHGVKQVCFS